MIQAYKVGFQVIYLLMIVLLTHLLQRYGHYKIVAEVYGTSHWYK